MKMTFKIVAFVALLSIYFLVSGATGWHSLYGRKLVVIYGFGAVLALWVGGEPIGMFRPITLRPIFMAVGIIIMLAVFILMYLTRDEAR